MLVGSFEDLLEGEEFDFDDALWLTQTQEIVEEIKAATMKLRGRETIDELKERQQLSASSQSPDSSGK